ncbi:zinc ABC transporter substrate-binding protein [Rhodobacteraceae bacterium NNCM2]|nr:zinc ABC transporter substrate-binding protein [Coraliihabitans acroporae]
MRATRILVGLSSLVAAAATAPAKAETTLVATVGMVAQPAEELAAGCAVIETMMGPGIDPHLYKPSSGDVKGLFDADGVLYAGYHLEGQLGEVLAKLKERKPVLAAAEAGASEEVLIFHEGSDYPDPHLWMDVALWSGIAPPIAAMLEEVSPACEGAESRVGEYQAQLAALDGWIREAVATIPEDQRIMVTAHDAFSYYGRAYGIEVQGIQGISTDSEAGIADIRKVVDVIVEQNVPAIFIESTISPRTINAVIEAAKARGHDVKLGGELFSDAMGEAGTAEGTYIGMLHANTVAVVTALGGTLPPLPEELAEWAKRWNVRS